MSNVQCPACGNVMDVPPQKSSGLPWAIGCLIALAVIPMVMGVVGLLAAIAIPSFVKARSTSQKNACINNMRMLDSAKEQWALAERKSIGDAIVTIGDNGVNAYMKFGETPFCPAGGTYTYHLVGQDPECSIHGTLSESVQHRSVTY